MSETWVSIPDWDQYEASTLGRIRRRFVLRTRAQRRGYLEIKLSKDGKAKTKLVHRLVASAFLGVNNDKHVNHRDGDKTNNRPDNLEFVSEAENKKHAAALGLMQHSENRYNAKLKNVDVIKIRELALSGVSHAQLAARFGVSQPIVTRIVNRKIWRHV
jgi:hypothetical protein